MKTLRMIGMALLAVLMCVNFNSCSNDENEILQQDEEIMVSLGLGGEISVSESPLSRAEAEVKPDLYGIQIYSLPNSSESSTTEYTPYAYGLFDDISNIKISLNKGYKYKVAVLLIKDGKNKVHFKDPEYDTPFDIALENKFILNTTEKIHFDAGISVSGSTINSSQQFFYAEAEKYYGETTDFIPSEENNNIDIYMKKMFFGGKFVAENLTEGTLTIKFDNIVAPQINIVPSQKTATRIFSIRNCTTIYYKDDSSAICTLSVQIIWTKADGAEIPLGTHSIKFKRNKMHTITIKIADITSSPGLDLELEDTEMSEEGSTTIENGEIVDTNIGTEGE
ncbi:MAG: hypothetical protein E7096_06740 [Bacteroides sp.]|nr:hypothetical protein [Bacteroides sp.]